jgi:hypothetical protein
MCFKAETQKITMCYVVETQMLTICFLAETYRLCCSVIGLNPIGYPCVLWQKQKTLCSVKKKPEANYVFCYRNPKAKQVFSGINPLWQKLKSNHVFCGRKPKATMCDGNPKVNHVFCGINLKLPTYPVTETQN